MKILFLGDIVAKSGRTVVIEELLALRRGRGQEARRAAERAIAIDPEFVQAHVLLGAVLMMLAEEGVIETRQGYQAAMRSVDTAIGINHPHLRPRYRPAGGRRCFGHRQNVRPGGDARRKKSTSVRS